MPIKRLLLRFAVMAFAAGLAGRGALAQEVSASHLAAAHEAVFYSNADRGFNDLLPSLSQQVQNQLIRIRPDLYMQITDAVEATALELVKRRVDLDNDVARVWAKTFTEDELKAITAFYKTPAGVKFLEAGPKAFSESLQVAKSWSDRVRDEMLEKARAELKKRNIEF